MLISAQLHPSLLHRCIGKEASICRLATFLFPIVEAKSLEEVDANAGCYLLASIIALKYHYFIVAGILFYMILC